jgi:hypothetical protein
MEKAIVGAMGKERSRGEKKLGELKKRRKKMRKRLKELAVCFGWFHGIK